MLYLLSLTNSDETDENEELNTDNGWMVNSRTVGLQLHFTLTTLSVKDSMYIALTRGLLLFRQPKRTKKIQPTPDGMFSPLPASRILPRPEYASSN
jgi:hypothetical protein